MNEVYAIAPDFRLGLALLLFWFLIFKVFREYRVDALRERLFCLREELFDYAADGKVAFGSIVYGRLRQLINSQIRFAHRMTFSRVLLGLLLFYFNREEPLKVEALEEWHMAVSEQPREVQEKLLAIHNRSIHMAIRYMAIGSPLLFILICLFVVLQIFNGTAKRSTSLVTVLPCVEIWETQVIEEDRQERHGEKVFA